MERGTLKRKREEEEAEEGEEVPSKLVLKPQKKILTSIERFPIETRVEGSGHPNHGVFFITSQSKATSSDLVFHNRIHRMNQLKQHMSVMILHPYELIVPLWINHMVGNMFNVRQSSITTNSHGVSEYEYNLDDFDDLVLKITSEEQPHYCFKHSLVTKATPSAPSLQLLPLMTTHLVEVFDPAQMESVRDSFLCVAVREVLTSTSVEMPMELVAIIWDYIRISAIVH